MRDVLHKPVQNPFRSALRALPAFAVVLLCAFSSPVWASGPADFVDLARQGAPDLALRLLDRHQPDVQRDPRAWMGWEQARLDVLARGARWERLIERVNTLPPNLPPGFMRAAKARQAQAHLELGQGREARAVLRELIWDPEGPPDAQTLAAFRRLIVESYLADGLLDDAQIALQRYRQDYPEARGSELILQARVLLRADRPQSVPQVLDGVESAEARALLWLAGLRAGAVDTERVMKAAEALAAQKDTAPADRARLWFTASLAADAQGQLARRVQDMERALQWRPALAGRDAVFRVTGDALWQAYLDYGLALGNQAQLLVGDDESWLTTAERHAAKHAVIGPRSLYAVVALQGLNPTGRDEAHRRLAASLLAEEASGREVLAGLYLHSERYADVQGIPQVIRYELADDALARSDIETASRLMAGLSAPPAGVDPFQWQLRRARVHILGGQEEAGIDVLYSVLASVKNLDRNHADRFLQVVFDLQTVKRHEAAINLFVALQPRLEEPQQRRELLYWQAESYQALGEYEQAAWLYLRSATLLDPHAFDPWAQTARFHAGEALTEAGLLADARRIYQDLLSSTKEPDRRVVLRHRLQQLHLQD